MPFGSKSYTKAQKMEDIEKKRKEMLKKKLEEERAEKARMEEEARLRAQEASPASFLRLLGITDKSSWRKWLLKNHPDKAGPQNERICQQVITAGRAVGY